MATQEDYEQVKNLAKELGIQIGHTTKIEMWPYPILVELKNRIIQLEKTVEEIADELH